MKSLILVLVAFIVGCQTAPPQEPEVSKERLHSELEQFKKETIEKVRITIRNEIIPELREVQLGQSRALSKKQRKIKAKIRDKILLGRVEWIKLMDPDIPIRARVDTGAQTCSLHAVEVVEKEIGGEKYVEFTTLDETARKHRMVKKVVEETRVRSTSGKSETRYVVEMDLILGKRTLKVKVNLNDRKKLRHRFLIGRNLLLGEYVVDVSQSRVLGNKP